MRGVVAREAQCVVVEDLPEPVADVGSLAVVIAVEAAGVNRLDTMQRKGKVKPPPGTTECLGLEVAGKVIASGSGSVAVGSEVMALVQGGAFAERVVVHEATVMPKPPGLSMVQAAAVPETWLTAFQLLFMVGQVKAGDTVLLHAAASGVGIAATQLAVAAGATVVTTASSEEKLAAVAKLGAAGGVATPRDPATGLLLEPWLPKALALLPDGKTGFDVVLCCVGGAYAEQNVTALATDGRYVLYSLLTGPNMGDVAGTFLSKIMAKRGSLLATTLRGRPVEYKAELVRRFGASGALEKLASGEYTIVIDKEFSGLGALQAAHDHMESNANIGKIVLSLA